MSASLIVQTRFARPQIMMNGADYYSTLAPYLISFEYTDSCDGEKGDSISIELDDRDGRFIGPDHPQKGAFFDCSIACVNWRAPGDNVSLECGRFWIDSVSFSGPEPDVLTIRANSIPTDSKVKSKQSTRAWENTDLKKVAEQIAGENQMSVQWEGDESPQFKRLEQTEASDLAFLKQKAKDSGLSIKVSKRQIIFFDEQKYEEKPPSFTLAKGNPNLPQVVPMRSYSFSTSFTDTAKSCTVSYVNPETGRLTKETAEDLEIGYADGYRGELIINENPGYQPDEPDGGGEEAWLAVLPAPRALTEYPTPDFKDAAPKKNRGKGAAGSKVAKKKAKKELRDKNKEATKAGDKSSTFGIEIYGWPLIAAGQTCTVQGFGFYDGLYFVVSARHKVGGEYETSLSIRKCLKGY